jgi:hypothetical protein
MGAPAVLHFRQIPQKIKKQRPFSHLQRPDDAKTNALLKLTRQRAKIPRKIYQTFRNLSRLEYVISLLAAEIAAGREKRFICQEKEEKIERREKTKENGSERT